MRPCVKSYSNRQIDLVLIRVPRHLSLTVTVTITVTITALLKVSAVVAVEVRQEMGEANPLVLISRRPIGTVRTPSRHIKSLKVIMMMFNLKIQTRVATRRSQ